MYAVMILEEALEDLRNIVAYIASENPNLIYYRIQEKKRVVEIIAFKHGAQIK
jgi:plasmid stabilization system protein ParE